MTCNGLSTNVNPSSPCVTSNPILEYTVVSLVGVTWTLQAHDSFGTNSDTILDFPGNTVKVAVPNKEPVAKIYPAGTSCTTNHATTAYVDSAGTCFCDAANCQGGSPTCYDASNAICEPAPGSCTEVDTIEDLNYPIGLDIGLVACANDPDGDALTYSWGISNYSNDWNTSNSENLWLYI